MKIQTMLAVAALCALPLAAAAQQNRPAAQAKKLYCWNENGRKVCGDALPPEAVDAARTEHSISGRPLARLGEQLSPEARVAAEEAAHQARIAANAEAARLRRELAMAESYETEEDLRRAFNDRIVLVDEGLKTSQLGTTNLRQSLVSLLRQANELELLGKPVGRPLAASIRAQHTDLLRQQAILRQQQEERASLDAELEHAIERYHALRTPRRR